MTSSRPYLIRALYDWIVDNGMTPHIVVDASAKGATLPLQYIRDGQIVLNISPSAVQRLHLGNDEIHFGARFAGQALEVVVPPQAVLAIYARENGEGMMFRDDGKGNTPSGGSPVPSAKAGKPSLKVVK